MRAVLIGLTTSLLVVLGVLILASSPYLERTLP